MQDIKDKILELKKQKNAIILAHNYQPDEVQEIADIVGDSFALSKAAKETDFNVIIFCGVKFMAETAKILSPQKCVLLPAPDAGCPMADMITEKDILRLKEQHPDAAVVCYVNTSAEVKAVSDICCTSSNAVKVVKALPQKKIIFVPDRNLAHYVASFVPEKEIIIFDGHCIVHNNILVSDVEKARAAVPDALLLVHPECPPDVVKLADFAGSTAQIIDFIKNSDKEKFIIGTEQGILHTLKKNSPEKKFFMLSPRLLCVNMKKISLESVYKALLNMQFEIKLDKNTINKASLCLEKMLKI